MTDILREDRDHGITILSLNRPEALNALSPALFVALRAEIDRIAQEIESVGCVILRGEGRSFSAGNDLKAIQAGQKPPRHTFRQKRSRRSSACRNLLLRPFRGIVTPGLWSWHWLAI